ncbi:metallophosphoesterase, partial [Hyphococcus sp.]|uniref:metallophosphoesterase n=1 Tax=Hyphococcus sp. TaxID=2038636 RepID=UPI0035C67924
MVKIAHLSDLHFGRDRPELLDPLIRALNDAQPDLVAVSGDLTQRARDHQFA